MEDDEKSIHPHREGEEELHHPKKTLLSRCWWCSVLTSASSDTSPRNNMKSSSLSTFFSCQHHVGKGHGGRIHSITTSLPVCVTSSKMPDVMTGARIHLHLSWYFIAVQYRTFQEQLCASTCNVMFHQQSSLRRTATNPPENSAHAFICEFPATVVKIQLRFRGNCQCVVLVLCSKVS